MPENLGSDHGNAFYASVAAENMTRSQLNYLVAVAKGKPSYDNAQNIAVATANTLPDGIKEVPTKEQAFRQIELAAKGGHAASMMKMGDLTRKQNDGLPAPDQVKSVGWLTKAHEKLEATINDQGTSAAQRADAYWDMSAVHYYNFTLPEGHRADLKFPDGINNPSEADLYYTTLAARSGTNHRYGEWVERVNEGVEYNMDAGRKAEIMGMANAVDLPTPRIYGSGKENLGEAHNYPPYVSTVASRADMLEAWKNGQTNPADPVDDKFTSEKQEKLDKLDAIKGVAPNMPVSAMEKESGQPQAQAGVEPKPLAANFNAPSISAGMGLV